MKNISNHQRVVHIILKHVTEGKSFKQGARKVSESFKNSGGIKEAVAFIEGIVH